MTQKRPLTDNDEYQLQVLSDDVAHCQKVLRKEVMRVLQYASFREVSEATGISTSTLQRWKREAQ